MLAQQIDLLHEPERKALAAATVVELQAVQVASAADRIEPLGGNGIDDTWKTAPELDWPDMIG
ncbi:hypothetical protein D3C72_2565880 [compost metagenome]